MRDTGFDSEPSLKMWAGFLAVVLKGSFYNCSSYSEIYALVEEFGDTSDLLPENVYSNEEGTIGIGHAW